MKSKPLIVKLDTRKPPPKPRGRPKGRGLAGNSTKPSGKETIPKAVKKPVVPYHRKPLELSLEAWQMALRRQFAEKHPFGVENLGEDPVFSDYRVSNPENRNSYKVSIRDNENSFHFCSCYDFKTNGLGTCKHIEAVVRRIRKNRKLNKLYLRKNRPGYSSVYLNYLDGRTVKIRIGTIQEEEFRAIARDFFNEAGELRLEMIGRFEKFLKQAVKIHPSFRCYPDALEYILELRDSSFRNSLIEKQYEPFLKNGKFEGIIKATLFKYQKEGICFAIKAGRCLIADDMGLGKTVQALAVSEVMKREIGIGSSRLCSPERLLRTSWKSSIQ